MPAKWQTVRVFISSTFRDMHAERDHLVRFVFPELKEKCCKHRVNLIDVDLRSCDFNPLVDCIEETKRQAVLNPIE